MGGSSAGGVGEASVIAVRGPARGDPRDYARSRISSAVDPNEDIDGEPCDADLDNESEETLYCPEGGAVVERSIGELLGHGTPME